MEKKGITSKAYFTSLTLIHTSLLLSQVLLLLLFYYVKSTGGIKPNEQIDQIYFVVVPAVILVGIVVSTYIRNKKIKTIKEKQSLQEKLSLYRGMLVIRYIIIEFTSFFSLIAFYSTGNYLYLVLSALLVFDFILIRPTKDKLCNDLELDANDKAIINDPDAVVMIIKP